MSGRYRGLRDEPDDRMTPLPLAQEIHQAISGAELQEVSTVGLDLAKNVFQVHV